MARGLAATGIARNLVTAGRLVSALWFISGLLLLYALLGECGVSGAPRLLGALLPAMVPFAVFQSATITNDVTAIPSAAVVLLCALRVYRGVTRPWVLVVVGVVSTWLRLTNGFGVALACLFLFVASRQQDEPQERRRLALTAISTAGATAAAGLIWAAMVGQLAKAPVEALRVHTYYPRGFRFADVFDSIAPMVPPTSSLPNVSFWTKHSYVPLLGSASGWVIIAGPLLALERRYRHGAALALGAASGAMLLVVAPAIAVVDGISADSFLSVPFPGRLAFAVLPGCIASALVAIGRSRTRLPIMAISALGLLGVLATVV